MATLPDDLPPPPGPPGSDAAHAYLWKFPGVVVELTHNHGTESDDSFAGYHNGNDETPEGIPRGGFGHIAVNTPDVYAFCEELEGKGVRFQKKPNEGRMKGLAFALDPDNYWVRRL